MLRYQKFELLLASLDIFAFVSSLDEVSSANRILDIGARNCIYSNYIKSSQSYFSNDMYQNKENSIDYVGKFDELVDLNLIPSFDVGLALDVLEHVENASNFVKKMLSVCNKSVIVLPNMAHPKHRINFFAKGSLGGKYTFEYPEPVDRHRWLTTTETSISYFQNFSKAHSLEFTYKPFYGGKSHKLTSLLLTLEVQPWQDVFIIKRK